jgi:small-conductance mechanosensitive channel
MEYLQEFLERDLVPFVETRVTPLTLLLFLLTVIGAAVLGRVVRTLTMRLLAHRGGASEGVAYAVGRIGQYLILAGGVLFALDNVGIDVTALAALGAVISVGIGFGLQNIAQNFISGVILLVERPVQKGDFVQLGDTEGSVAEIEMRATRVITRDGISVLVPNSKLISDEVRNLSAPSSQNRLRVEVGVAYGSDTARVRDTLLEVAAADPRVLQDPAPLVLFQEFGDSSLNFELCVWLADPQPRPVVSSELRFAIDRAFRERDIAIPFPQRDLHLVSGFEKLRETA